MSKVWNSLWKTYQNIDSVAIMNEPGGMLIRSELAGVLLKYFDLKDKHILEVGTGTGQYCIEMALRGADCVGIDKDPESIKLAKRISEDYKMSNSVFLEMDLFDYESPDYSKNKENDPDYDIVLSMGILEHFNDKEIVNMLKEMGKLGKYVVVGVPYSGSDVYKMSRLYSQKKGTWEYGFERDFETLSELFKKAGIALHHEQVIGMGSEACYLKRINPELIPLQLSQSLKKAYNGNDNVGSWLVAIGSTGNNYLNEKPTYEGVSIIIPVYNGEKYIKRSVENLRGFNYPDLEIIYVNDCSTDNTRTMLEKELKIALRHNARLINFEKNQGEHKARYEGLKKATNDYIFFLDIDDLIFPGCISKIMRDIKNCPEGTYLSNSCALMKDGVFTGEIWYHQYLKTTYDYIISELSTLSGKISLGNTVIKKSSLIKAYEKLNMLYEKLGIERMKVSPDSLLLDIMVFSGLIKQIVPIYYTYRGYEQNEGSASQQIDDRIKDIPLQMAYCFTEICKVLKIKENTAENAIIYKAIQSYGIDKGTEFVENFRKYKKSIEEVINNK